MKFKVNICSYRGFRQAVTSCRANVYWHTEEKKVIITPKILEKLETMYKQNHGVIRLWIETEDPSDYFKLIFAACL